MAAIAAFHWSAHGPELSSARLTDDNASKRAGMKKKLRFKIGASLKTLSHHYTTYPIDRGPEPEIHTVLPQPSHWMDAHPRRSRQSLNDAAAPSALRREAI